MLFVANEAILMFSPYWTLLPFKLQMHKLTEYHGYAQGAAFSAFSVAFAAIYVNKEDNGKPHFKTWHGFLGLLLAVFIMIQITLGAIAKYAKFIPIKVNVSLVKTCHDLLGGFVILFCIGNMCTACFTNFFASQFHTLFAYLSCAVFVFIYGFVSIRVFSTNRRIVALFK